MRDRAALLLAATMITSGCAAATPHSVAPADYFENSRTPSKVTGHLEGLSANASTFVLAESSGSVPKDWEPLVVSLLERRGWSHAEDRRDADLQLDLAGGSQPVGGGSIDVGGAIGSGGRAIRFNTGTYGPGDVLDNTGGGGASSVQIDHRSLHLCELLLRVEARQPSLPEWQARAWVTVESGETTARQEVEQASLPRLLAALADQVPTAPLPSSERAALDRLGTDLLVLPTDRGVISPVVLAVRPGSVVERAGWLPRDVLVDVDGADVVGLSWSEIARRLADAEREPVRVEVLRGAERYLTFLVPAPIRAPSS